MFEQSSSEWSVVFAIWFESFYRYNPRVRPRVAHPISLLVINPLFQKHAGTLHTIALELVSSPHLHWSIAWRRAMVKVDPSLWIVQYPPRHTLHTSWVLAMHSAHYRGGQPYPYIPPYRGRYSH